MDITAYRIALPPAWQECANLFLGGYEAEMRVGDDWKAVSHWGQQGYELGSWPMVMVFVSKQEGTFIVVEYQEGEYTAYQCPTEELLNAVIDELALYWWKILARDLVVGIETVDQAPATLRGPYRGASQTTE